jgi:hypothetical protein
MNVLRRRRKKLVLCAQLVTILVGVVSAYSAQKLQVCFSPPPQRGCDPSETVVRQVDAARKTILMR